MQLQEDFEGLKNIFSQADNEKDYLVVFVG